MPKHSYTVTPSFSIDPRTGEYILDYDHANVDDSSGREAVLRDHQLNQHKMITTDERGHSTHAADDYSITDQGSVFNNRTGEVFETEESIQYSNLPNVRVNKAFTDQQLEDAINHVGSREEFSRLMEFSNKNSSNEFKTLFLRAANNSDVASFNALYRDLRAHYEAEN